MAVMRWRVWLGIGVASAMTLEGGTAAGSNEVRIRLVTYNVLNGVGFPGALDYEAVGDMITWQDVDGPGPNMGLEPHIVGFQEIDQAGSDIFTFRDEFLPGFSVHLAPGDGFNRNALLVHPDLTVLDYDNLTTFGPRRSQRITVTVPGSDAPLTVYNAHFKSGTDSSSRATRETEAQELGFQIWNDRTNGLDIDDNGAPDLLPPDNGFFVAMGDLNSNNNFDLTIDGVFTNVFNGQPTGVLNLPVETLNGRFLGGSPLTQTFGSSFRLDYICADELLAERFDVDGIPGLSQDEVNSMGFVYVSTDNNPDHTSGQFANGNSSATSTASDHRPVVFDLYLPGSGPSCAGDVNGDGSTDSADLSVLIGNFGMAVPVGTSGDLNGDGVVDSADLSVLIGDFACSPDQ